MWCGCDTTLDLSPTLLHYAEINLVSQLRAHVVFGSDVITLNVSQYADVTNGMMLSVNVGTV